MFEQKTRNYKTGKMKYSNTDYKGSCGGTTALYFINLDRVNIECLIAGLVKNKSN